jgi:hypothetical protein
MVAGSIHSGQDQGVWGVVDRGDTFTPCRPPGWHYALVASFRRDNEQEPQSLAPTTRHEADRDIASGRVHRFDSVENLLKSLHDE